MSDLTDKSFWDSRWNNNIREYDFVLSSREMKRTFARALQHVPQEGSLLELGVAPGRMVPIYNAIRSDISIDGLDISELGIERTREVYQRIQLQGELHCCDLRDFAPTEGYDMVVSHGLIEHFENYEDIVHHHFRFAKPGGWVFVTIPNYATQPVRGMIHRFSDVTVDTHNLNCMSEAALRSAILPQNPTDWEVGKFGGAYFPHSAVNPGLGGQCYKQFCRTWNLGISLLALATRDRLFVHVWDSALYFLAQRPHET